MYARNFKACAGALAAVLGLFGGFAGASEYVPNRAADKATFKSSLFGTTVSSEIDRTSGSWQHYTQFAGFGPTWIWTHASHEKVYIFNTQTGTYAVLADFAAAVGTKTRIDAGGCNQGEVTIAEKGRTVSTPAGTFTDCILLTLSGGPCRDAGVGGIAFAKGIGVVSWSESNIAGTNTFELVSGTIGGTTYPAKSGISVTSVFGTVTPVIDRKPRPAGTPYPITTVSAFITIQNDGNEDLVLGFSSSQMYEIEVIDARGVSVSRWSRGKMFMQALRDVTIAPGDNLRLGAEVELTDDQGNALPAGRYTLKVTVRSREDDQTHHKPGARPFSAQTPIVITHAL